MNDRLVRKYIREAILLELKWDEDEYKLYGDFFSGIWNSIKSSFSGGGSGSSVDDERGVTATGGTSINISKEIDGAFEDFENYFDKKINSSSKNSIKKKATEIYDGYRKKGSTESAAAQKALQFVQLQIGRMST